MDPLVSVNITTYNRAELLPRCIESVLAQSYENMEIIIVDDCSSDETSEVIKRYVEKSDQIEHIRHEENRGLPAARNTGWKNSNGKYIAFMDDDDVWIDEDKIAKQVNILENTTNRNLALVSTSVRLHQDKDSVHNKVISRPHNLKARILRGNGIMYTPTVMTKRCTIQKVGGFDRMLSRGIDSDFYRTCIVRFDYDVEFMPDVTTAIHEYGNGRITALDGLKDHSSRVLSELYVLWKYKVIFLRYPVPALVRIKKIGSSVYQCGMNMVATLRAGLHSLLGRVCQ